MTSITLTKTWGLPDLYELSTAGNIKTWGITVVNRGETADIITHFGIYGGKLQETSDTIRAGKNEGRANETTVFEQAMSEATSKWEKKKKKGYVETLEGAQAGELDELITGGIEPMLALVYAKQGHKITYPAYVQPKLDGMRCIAIKKGDSVTLWSRSRKPINSCPHIEEAIAIQFAGQDIILDGELYNHALKDEFEMLMSAAKKSKPSITSFQVQYHIYDVVSDEPFIERLQHIGELHKDHGYDPILIPVDTVPVPDEVAMYKLFKRFLDGGYEGLIIRNTDGLYENKRSVNLQKVKEFDDAEFLIVGVNEGRGKLQGTLGAFTCETIDGTRFDVKMMGNQEENAKYLNGDASLWYRRYLTVQYQGITNRNGVPRFPVGVRIREAE